MKTHDKRLYSDADTVARELHQIHTPKDKTVAGREERTRRVEIYAAQWRSNKKITYIPRR